MPIKLSKASEKHMQTPDQEITDGRAIVAGQGAHERIDSSRPQPLANNIHSRLTRHDLSLWLLLLVIICLGGLGSLSFAVPQVGPNAGPNTPTPMPTSTLSIPSEGACTAKPGQVHYLPSQQGSEIEKATLATWQRTKRTALDFNNVQACASTFITDYETFNTQDLKTLETGSSMFSNGARLRFYGQAPYTQPNLRINQQWRASIQKLAFQHTARSYMPSLLYTRKSAGKLLVWIAVPYLLSTSIHNTTFRQYKVATVLLVGSHKGTGWQVSDWREGKGTFTTPSIL